MDISVSCSSEKEILMFFPHGFYWFSIVYLIECIMLQSVGKKMEQRLLVEIQLYH